MDKRSNADNRNLCCFSYSDGRQCRMLRHPDHPGLCPFHSREERQALESERIGTELAATLTGHFLTDPSTATGYGCYGLATSGWAAPVTAVAGVSPGTGRPGLTLATGLGR